MGLILFFGFKIIVMPEFVEKKFVKKNSVQKRDYQKKIAEKSMHENLLVVAPTATGKTVIALLSIANFIEKNGLIVFLAPTKPLVEQHADFLKRFLNVDFEVKVLTGEKKSGLRKKLWENAKIVCCTPQTMKSDIEAGRLNPKKVCFAVFDEAHRAVSNYAYVPIAKKLLQANSKILALTASPGHTEEKIKEIMENLGISKVEIFSREDEEIRKYLKPIAIEWKKISLTKELKEIAGLLKSVFEEKIGELKKSGVVTDSPKKYYKRSSLVELQKRISAMLSGKKSSYLYTAASKVALLLKIGHAIQLIETQGTKSLNNYLSKIFVSAKSYNARVSDKIFEKDPRIRKAFYLSKKLEKKGFVHPKLVELKKLVLKEFEKNKNASIIVFNHFRDSVIVLEKELNSLKGVKAKSFVGQATKGKSIGLSQKQQKKILEEFKSNKHNVLIATSVAEEGLDIPSCDLVIFYEPVPSEIRHIQRSGRTGRKNKGKAIILITANTMDESFIYSAKRKEKNMYFRLKQIKDREERPVKQLSLYSFEETNNSVRVYADKRERNSFVVNELKKKGIEVIEKQMDVADYVLSDSIGVERKTVKDFLSSLVDGRLFSQLMNLVISFEKPLLLLEGMQEELFTLRNIHRNAIIGALSSIALKFQIPIIYTKDEYETAEFLYIIACREQLSKNKTSSLRIRKKNLSFAEQQRFVVESLPLVGPKLAGELLEKFGSIKAIANASQKDLMKVKKVGEKKAKQIFNLFNKKYMREN